MNLKELQPIYDNCKSFYKKAYYIIEEYEYHKSISLYSYNTLVLKIIISYIPNTKTCYKFSLNYEIDTKYLFSNTTLRHIKECLKQFIPYFKNMNITKKYLENTLGKIIQINNQ